MNRLRYELAGLSGAMIVWSVVTHAGRLEWLLVLGYLLGAMSAVALSYPRPWDPR